MKLKYNDIKYIRKSDKIIEMNINYNGKELYFRNKRNMGKTNR